MIDLAESARHSMLHLRLWRPLEKSLMAAYFFLLGTVRVRGKYRVPRKGGLLVLSNHLADVDPVVIQVACPRPMHFMAKSELFEIPIIGTLLRGTGNYPVKRGEPDRAPLKLSAQLLKDGEVVGVFPEGELSESGELQGLKTGVALIVRLAAGVPVICCGLRNTQRFLPYGKFIPRPCFRHADVVWGEPRIFDKTASADEIMGWIEGQLRSLSAA